MNEKIKLPNKMLRWVGSFIAAGLVIYLLFEIGWTELASAFRSLSLSSILLAFTGVVFSRICIGLRWWFLLPGRNNIENPLGFADAAKLHFAGLFANNFLPTTIGGDAVKWVGSTALGVGGTRAAASVIMDRLIGVLGMVLLAPVGGWIYFHAVEPFSSSSDMVFGLSAGSTGFIQKISKRLHSIFIQIKAVLSHYVNQPIVLLQSFIATLLHMGGLFFSIWQIFSGLDQDISFWQVAGLWSLVYFITLIPISINSIGLQEMSVSLIFPLAAGVSEESGILMALIYRALMMTASLVGGLFIGDLMMAARARSDEGGLLREVALPDEE